LKIDIADGHLATACMKLARDRRAHAARAAGDQGAASLEGEAAIGGKGKGLGHRRLSVLLREIAGLGLAHRHYGCGNRSCCL
jgi:hypothetical protein